MDVLKGNSNSLSEMLWSSMDLGSKANSPVHYIHSHFDQNEAKVFGEGGNVPNVLIIQLSYLLLSQLLGIKTLLCQLSSKTTPSEPCPKGRMHAISCHFYSYAKKGSWGDTLKNFNCPTIICFPNFWLVGRVAYFLRAYKKQNETRVFQHVTRFLKTYLCTLLWSGI